MTERKNALYLSTLHPGDKHRRAAKDLGYSLVAVASCVAKMRNHLRLSGDTARDVVKFVSRHAGWQSSTMSRMCSS
jgi:hypothetical protein